MADYEAKACYTLKGSDITGRRVTTGSIKTSNTIYRLITLGMLLVVWTLAAKGYHSDLLLPSPVKTFQAFFGALQDVEILQDLLLTLSRVLTGLTCALFIGLTLGFLMGFSKTIMTLIDPIVGTVRQVPIMAWVPLTIIWFGLGDGPTIFLIAIAGVFPILLNTIAGVQDISKDYYNAAYSMGAKPWSIFIHVIVPASLPSILTGVRLALSAGWMSVICAEFIATSSGFGYAMVYAQTKMETPLLIALMIMAALVGYGMDYIIMFLSNTLTKWRLVKQ